jgi:hypothetical protein
MTIFDMLDLAVEGVENSLKAKLPSRLGVED